ncbi:penicillin-binding protein 2 [Bifidobacterium sp. ESL0763]|uniref:peptidoglycan D,D-transpeptidase FtsI family protein n=1 Tax=Bifidobacterium sp. ESL0763 TaxID=2983227 RepID=UPI0023F61B2E|nr:penicillin-binding protein 2 [Bifidobacterium sp. ESL0763]MDF7664154.1 penicillin-binding protein 2 [Bifidobacterium sp. ESL0763]
MFPRLVNFVRTRQFAFRCIVIGVVLATLFVFCFGQLASIQLLNGKSTAEAATAGRTMKVPVGARRGKILDANGAVLSQSVERYTIIGDPEAAQSFQPIDCTPQTKDYCHQVDGKPVGVTGAAAVGRLLAPLLGMSSMEIGAKLSVGGHYAVLKRDVEPNVKRAIEKLNLGDVVQGQLSQNRVYANGTMMGALLGGVDDSGTGVAGLEQTENAELAGKDGYKVYQQGNGGVEIPGTLSQSVQARDGSDVSLTIDADVDWYVKKVLVDGKKKYNADWAIACVEDTRTHQIIALDDSDEIEAGSDQAKLNVSRAVSQTFEPGSIGKVFSMAGLMQSDLHQMSDKFRVPDHLDKNGQVFKDVLPHPVSNWTMAGILQESSNVGMVMASEKYTSAQRYDFLTKFGIGQPTGLGLPGESQGTLRGPETWDGRTRDTILFGQGYATNVLQLTNAIATVADDGVYQKPSIIKTVTDANGHETVPAKSNGRRVVDHKADAQLLDAMESSAEHYQQFSGVDGYRVAAKSGTAEVSGGDGKLSGIVSDWSGILPADNPRFVVTVVMGNPQGSLGGMTSGPLFKQIGEFLMQKYEVPNSTPRKGAIPVQW